MIQPILKSNFVQMPWKNGKGITTEIFIYPPTATIAKNNFFYRLSSAPINQNTTFSLFSGKQRLLTNLKGAGFRLNSDEYEKFEVAHFSGDEIIECKLLKGPVLDFGVIYDPQKVKVQAKILNLKMDFNFSLELQNDYFITVLNGEIMHGEQSLKELETLHFQKETNCSLRVLKSAVVIYITVATLP
jgi:environmental stress-induced protein Ves